MKLLKFLYHNILLSLTYTFLGLLCIYFALNSGNVNVFWPPSGLAIACAYLFGPYVYPGIFIGSLLVNSIGLYLSNFSFGDFSWITLSSLLALGALTQSIFGSLLLHRCRDFKTKLETAGDVICFFVLGGLVSSLLSASAAIFSLLMFEQILVSMVVTSWALWYTGDVLGVLVFGPAFLLILQGHKITNRRKLQVIIPTIIAFVLLELSYTAVKRWEYKLYTEEYTYKVQTIANALEEDIYHYSRALYSLRSLFASSDLVEKDEFNSFTNDLFLQVPELHSFLWVEIPADHKQIQPDEFKKQDTYEQKYIYPIKYLEPTNIKEFAEEKALPLPEIRGAIKEELDNNYMLIAPIELSNSGFNKEEIDRESEIYLKFILPVFDQEKTNEIRGYLISHLSTEKFLEQFLRELRAHGLNGSVIIQNETIQKELYKDRRYDEINGYEFSAQLEFFGVQLMIETKHPYYYYSEVNYTLWMILVVGLIFISIVTAFLLILTGRLSEIEELVLIRTHEERKLAYFLDSVLENIPNMVFVKDAKDLRFTHFNKAGEILLGKNKEEMIGKTDYDFFPKEQADFFVKNDREVLKSKTMLDIPEEPITDRNNEQRWLHTKKVPLFNEEGEPIYLLGVSEDISEQKKFNEEREYILKELERSNKDLESFAYVASHDMQEPIRMIKSFTGILKEQYFSQFDKKGQEYIEIIHSSSNSLKELVTDLLDYSRVGKDSESQQECDVNELIEEVLSNILPENSDRKINIDYNNLPILYVHKVNFSRVLSNLLTNSIKYSKQDEDLEISIQATQKTGKWEFKISDNGIGIKPEYHKKIFEPFKRLHNTKEYSGTGMGLAICKRIIESYNGKIWVENNPEGGTVFVFTLPIKENET
jgi:PAS domain S-box-containing protein